MPADYDGWVSASLSARERSAPELWVASLGRVRYDEAVAIQERIRRARQERAIPDALLLLEHPPVYTKGRRSERADLPMGEDWYAMQGIEVRGTDRGGRVTYHGPGQLVGYPIMLIDDVLAYVRTMERALLAALAEEGIEAEVREGLTGVWVGERKIGSIGVHVSRGVTTHGFAINVDNDLQPFEWIVPCGIEGVRMTSVYLETRRTEAMRCFRRRVASQIAEAYGRRQRLVSLAHLLGEGATRAVAETASPATAEPVGA
jgi:lipoyl(octanoyl) transferase